jgi:hypothetical protein
MQLVIAALAMLHPSGATAVASQPGGRPAASIPARFHGRWAENQRACRPRHFTSVITIDGRGWSSFEEGGRVISVGQVRRGTHYFRLNNWAGEERIPASLALRRAGPLLIVTLDADNAKPVHHRLMRCR